MMDQRTQLTQKGPMPCCFEQGCTNPTTPQLAIQESQRQWCPGGPHPGFGDLSFFADYQHQLQATSENLQARPIVPWSNEGLWILQSAHHFQPLEQLSRQPYLQHRQPRRSPSFSLMSRFASLNLFLQYLLLTIIFSRSSSVATGRKSGGDRTMFSFASKGRQTSASIMELQCPPIPLYWHTKKSVKGIERYLEDEQQLMFGTIASICNEVMHDAIASICNEAPCRMNHEREKVPIFIRKLCARLWCRRNNGQTGKLCCFGKQEYHVHNRSKVVFPSPSQVIAHLVISIPEQHDCTGSRDLDEILLASCLPHERYCMQHSRTTR